MRILYVRRWPLSFVIACSLYLHLGKTEECDFRPYHPLRFGTPTRGGHEQLATKKIMPVYPEDAKKRGIGGSVSVYVLIDSAGDVVKVCAVGQPLLSQSATDAVSQWKFQKDFGLTFADNRPSSGFAVLNSLFDFQPDQTTNACAAMHYHTASDRHGATIWLTSEDLMRRVTRKSDLAFPMLDGGSLHGEVKLDVILDKTGAVTCAVVISGNAIAMSSAMAAIKNWTFRPYVQRGRVTAVRGHLTIAYDVRQ